MRLREAVGALGVHYQAAYGWVRQQQLPARKVGRDYEISADHLRAFAARRNAGQPAATAVRVRTGRDWPAGCMPSLSRATRSTHAPPSAGWPAPSRLPTWATMSSARHWPGSGRSGRPARSRSRWSTAPPRPASGSSPPGRCSRGGVRAAPRWSLRRQASGTGCLR